MPTLETKYLGLKLKNPIIVASSGFTKSVEKIKECEYAGAGAVVLKSLFEEALSRDTFGIEDSASDHPEAFDYISGELELQYGLADYLKLIREAKAAVSIPIIASINCVSNKWWPAFAKKIQDAGADALELNVFTLPTDPKQTSEEVENIYYEILDTVRPELSIPIAIKIGPYFSALPHFVNTLYMKKANGIVLFNRFTEPDIDVNEMRIKTTFEFSQSNNIHQTLRWISILDNDDMEIDLCATTGIHTSEDILKMLLVGASSVQIASAFYERNLGIIKVLLKEIEDWMVKHNFNSIEDFKGNLSFKKTESPKKYLRAQFLEKIRSFE